MVGCGSMAGGGNPPRSESYAQVIKRSQLLTLAMAVDTNSKKATDFGLRYGCDTQTNLSKALSAFSPDVAVIASPDDDHAPSLMKILEHANCPSLIVVEKPVCVSFEELKKIKEISRELGVQVIVNHSRRLDSRYRQLREEIRIALLGAPVKIRCVYYGGWMHNGIHMVDILSFLFDQAPVWKKCTDVKPGRFPSDPSWSLIGTIGKERIDVEFEAIDESFYQLFELDFRFQNGRVLVSDFENEFHYFSAHYDIYGDRVLNNPSVEENDQGSSGTEKLIGLLAKSLLGEFEEQLIDLSLQSTESSMQSLFEGVLIGNQCRSNAQ